MRTNKVCKRCGGRKFKLCGISFNLFCKDCNTKVGHKDGHRTTKKVKKMRGRKEGKMKVFANLQKIK